MNTLKQILFTLVAVVGLSLAVSAQKGGDKKPPPKNPPEIPAPDKKPPKKEDDKPKKPDFGYFIALPPEAEYSE